MKNCFAILLLAVLISVPCCFAQNEPHHHHDAGEKLGTAGYLADLRRTTVGDFKIEDAVSPDGLEVDDIKNHLLTI